MIVNLSKGASATKAQKEQFEEMGMSAEWVAKAMQEDSVGTLDTIFKAINDLPQERQVAALSTLFGQWANEGGAKIVNNLDVYRKALEMVSDPSLYTGSMEREFNIKSQTPEAIETMLKSTKTALKIEIGDAFLPAKKQFNLSMIDFLNSIRKNMPELTQLAESLGTLASRGVEKLGSAMDTALPYIQKGLDYLINNGEQVVRVLGGMAAAFVGMKFAPAAEAIFSGGKGGLAGLFKSAQRIEDAHEDGFHTLPRHTPVAGEHAGDEVDHALKDGLDPVDRAADDGCDGWSRRCDGLQNDRHHRLCDKAE